MIPFGKLFSLVILASLASDASGAPTASASDLLQNGIDAQALNTKFASISPSDPCNDGDTACITGQAAKCSGGTWQLTLCKNPTFLSCFALPLLSGVGTQLKCTTKTTAEDTINNSGAQGGIFGDGSGGGNSLQTPSLSSAPAPASSSFVPPAIGSVGTTLIPVSSSTSTEAESSSTSFTRFHSPTLTSTPFTTPSASTTPGTDDQSTVLLNTFTPPIPISTSTVVETVTVNGYDDSFSASTPTLSVDTV